LNRYAKDIVSSTGYTERANATRTTIAASNGNFVKVSFFEELSYYG
jgi:hypothetical protein